ncbi:MAG: RnfABCDGE type electron transport complex subunit B [Treponema sp.]|jgi:Na+-translocating ferredoxin:NAD+ oxidoreductase RNF subunit RnfB|nr:RnfABCDGE type electron transport complex subunit B [Treponema sp.]
MIVAITAVFAFALAFVLGSALGFFRDFFAVPHDPLVDEIRNALPGANCGACGFPGCDAYAAAVAGGKTGITGCSAGGQKTAEALSALMGVSGTVIPTVSFPGCQGSVAHTLKKGTYTGIETCRGAKISAGGTKLCVFGCLGFGDCVKVCKFGALSMGENGLPCFDHSKCTGCKLCTSECPQQIIRNLPRNMHGAMVLCSNRSSVRAGIIKACKIACIKCGLCVKNCPQQCIIMENNLPRVDYATCTSCGTCAEKCPTKAFKILERDVIGKA